MCPLCKGLGYVREEVPFGDQLFGRLLRCECRREEDVERLRRISRLSPEMLTWHLADFRDRKGKLSGGRVLTDLLKKRYGWATLSGPPGTGKTFLLAALANEARELGIPAVYLTMAELLDDLRDAFRPDAGTGFSRLFEQVRRAPVLCLDELEKFNPTPWALEKFFELMERRYREWDQGITALATNRKLGQGARLLPEGYNTGYLESRIMDGRFAQVTDFWTVGDARPALEEQP